MRLPQPKLAVDIDPQATDLEIFMANCVDADCVLLGDVWEDDACLNLGLIEV